MTKVKPGSWMYLDQQLHLGTVSYRSLMDYLNAHDVRFFKKDAKWMADQVRSGQPFTINDLPNTIRTEDREEVTRLLNVVVGYYERQNQKKERQRQKIEQARKQIPDVEVDRLLYIFNHYGTWLRSDDKRQAKLESVTSINNWLNMTEHERKYWFQRVEAYAKHLRGAESRTRTEDTWRRRQEYRNFNQNRDYYIGILRTSHERIQAYATLGVPMTASHEEIKKAWKRLVLDHHPDRGGDPQRFIEINDAYRRITDKTD